MSAQEAELPLFTGDANAPELGVSAKVRYEHAEEHGFPNEEDAFRQADTAAYRAAPLLRLIGERGSRKLITGRMRIAVRPDSAPSVTILVTALWSERDRWTQVQDVRSQLDDALGASLTEPAHPVHGDEQDVAAILAKAVAESSHNEVTKVRALRYELERRLADQLANRKQEPMRRLLAEVIELSIAFNRARDEARAAIRDDLWRRDESAPRHGETAEPPGPETPVLDRMHYNAIRHCRSMSSLLEEETARLHSLQDSMSTISVAQDAEAQQNFNLFAAAAAAGLGLPALILSFYGAQTYLPLTSFDRAARALLPVGLTALVAVMIVLRQMPWRARFRHYAGGFTLVVCVLGVLWVAGALAPH
ncbi:hypothetical protein AB0L88_16780 [Saccharopolyspora shandongensis]|uniref:Mg2+ and Co2+ transporter CorA n=1 Tax=Saccharopolyspora shandongensis TaxID=418495 RepID=A0A1H3FIL6_9PSEU|nr:hypothetical protein [Saccharopolyspora shandongensis]SDX90902.1 hypothetical protein SAMN05216215_101733 [Saccharopolyspora shandongensis]